jgi:hypothetical protein
MKIRVTDEDGQLLFHGPADQFPWAESPQLAELIDQLSPGQCVTIGGMCEPAYKITALSD